MNLPFFNNVITNDMSPQPNEMYRDIQQAFICQQWDNTTALHCVQEQSKIGSNEYNEVESWVVPIVEDSTTGKKAGRDFAKLLFKNLNRVITMGLYYQFDNNYWLTYFFNDFTSVEKEISVRRCNNYLRIVDPLNGSIFSIPCTVDYDMSSPSVQVTSNILIPNNHATVMVQGNADTTRLFQTNTRYILGGRPFKLTGYQNAIMQDENNANPTLLYLDLYLDEKHANDNLELQLADNGIYDYLVVINSEDMKLTAGSTGYLSADVSLNGQEVDRSIIWTSSNPAVVSIDEFGEYEVVGEVDDSAIITATLSGNPNVYANIQITIVNQADIVATIIIDPVFDEIREFDTTTFTIGAFYGGNDYVPTQSIVSLSNSEVVLSNQYLSITKNDNEYTLECLQRATIPQILYISVTNTSPVFEASMTQTVDCVSMMG